MKYDFSTYLTQVLNEVKEEKPIYKDGVFTDINKTDEIKNWIENYSKRLYVKGKDLIYKNESGNEVNLTQKNPKLDLVKMFNAYKKSITEKGVVKSYNKDTFEKLGETYAYRSIVCFTIMRTGIEEDDFQGMTNDVFENDPDNVLMQIKDLQDYFDFAAACTTISKKLDKEEDKESETVKIATQYKELLNKPETRFDGIAKTKKAFEQDFTKYHDIFADAYDKGMKEQQKRMTEKDYKWEDPATGLPPKGFSQNAKKLFGKGIENLAAMGDKFAEKIKNSPHNLENDLARAAIIGVKLIGVGVHAAGKLVKWLFPKAVNIWKKINSKSVDKAINEFKKKYEEAKKGNYLPSQIKDETEEETKNKCETFKKDFQKLMYDELIPMYYKQVQVFSECYQNTNEYYILKQTKEGWETKQTENGKLTELWNAVLLLKNHIEKCDKLFQDLNLYEEFKENKMELYLGSIDKKQSNLSQKDLLTWFNKIDQSKTDDEKVMYLKRIANIYTEDIMLPAMSLNSKTFAEYKDKLNKSLLALNKIKEIPVITELKIAFNTDDTTTNVKGIIVHKEEKQEEQDTDAETLKNEYREIYNSLTELEKTNKLDDVKNKFEEIDQIANKTASQLKTIVDKQQDSEDKTELTKLIKNFENYTSFEKILGIKAIMNKLHLTESVALNTIINILNEDVENTSTIDNIKKEVTNVLKGEITTSNMKNIFDKIKNKIVELYNSSSDEIKTKLKNVKDELQLLYAISAMTNKSDDKQEEQPKQENNEPQKPQEVAKSDKSAEMKKS
jgi:hypothetical protein